MILRFHCFVPKAGQRGEAECALPNQRPVNLRTGPLGRAPTGWLPAAFPAAPLWAGVTRPRTQFSPHHRRGRFVGKSEAEVLPNGQFTCLTGTLQEPEPRISSSWICSQKWHCWTKARSCLDCLTPEPPNPSCASGPGSCRLHQGRCRHSQGPALPQVRSHHSLGPL